MVVNWRNGDFVKQVRIKIQNRNFKIPLQPFVLPQILNISNIINYSNKGQPEVNDWTR